ncbi:hypothetical protein GLYMA_06G011150v4 [Glycine max]|nr:hypothetical protein GLYMA_06G011150v4 [Glycine max]KAH1123631.1 hypothetical protein GYH30_013732 [Glycine max]
MGCGALCKLLLRLCRELFMFLSTGAIFSSQKMKVARNEKRICSELRDFVIDICSLVDIYSK